MRQLYTLLLVCTILGAAMKGSAQDTTTFNYTGKFETFVIQRTGWYLLDVAGGQGGASYKNKYQGGKGSRRSGFAYFNVGDTLQIAVGNKGFYGLVSQNGKHEGGGCGGGASSIVKRNGQTLLPLLMAAGGGGAGANKTGGKGYSAVVRHTDGWIKGGVAEDDNYKGGGCSGAGFFADGRSPAYFKGGSRGTDLGKVFSYVNGYGGLNSWGGLNVSTLGGGGQSGESESHSQGGGGGGGYRGGNTVITNSSPGIGYNGDGGFSYMDVSVIDTLTGVIPDGNSPYSEGVVSITYAPDFKPPFLASDSSVTFTFKGNQFQTFQAPVDGWYQLSAAGAQGGDAGNSSHAGGKGAVLGGHVYLKAGETLRIGVGGQGAKGNNVGNNVGGGGGGGASSIVKMNKDRSFTPLLFAGGGGGGSATAEGLSASLATQGDIGVGGVSLYNDDLFFKTKEFWYSTNKIGVGGAGGGGYHSNGQDVSIIWDVESDTTYIPLINNFIVGGEGYTAIQNTDLTLYSNNDGYLTQKPQYRPGFWTRPRMLTGNVGGYTMKRMDGSCCGGSPGGFGGGGAGGGALSGDNTSRNKDGGGGGGGGWSGGFGANEGQPGGGGSSYIKKDSLIRPVGGESGVNLGNGYVRVRYTPNYQGDSAWFFSNSTLDTFIVPKTGWYLLDASGGQGGSIAFWDKVGGKGARMMGYSLLKKGDTLLVETGIKGVEGYNTLTSQRAADGGGRSSIVKLNGSNPQNRFEPLVVAGGGGGAGFQLNGGDATLNSYGMQGPGNDFDKCGIGGNNGNGGAIGNSKSPGSGGGGFYTNGAKGFNSEGKAFPNINSGGQAGDGGTNGGGGGGGGYSGGGGGKGFGSFTASNGFGGGGGGSFLSTKLSLSGCQQYSGYNEGSGSVFIAYRPNYTPSEVFTFQGGQFMHYVVPTTGWYLLNAAGAQGGPASNFSRLGGKGAFLQGYAKLNAGDTLRVAVGGMGQVGANMGNNPSGGGGGGASSIVKIKKSSAVNPNDRYEPLIIAAGGGGAGSGQNGGDGTTSNNGLAAEGPGGVSGGGGGTGPSQNGGAGGAGYFIDGGTHCNGNCDGRNVLSYGGQAYLSGNSGAATTNIGGDGGFGGGGEGGNATNTVDGGGGGGGGYSGGGGGAPGSGGGGGGSYLSASLLTLNCNQSTNLSGDGTASIQYIPDFADTTVASFSYKGSFETYIVPRTGLYAIMARGGQGGPASNDSHIGGYGAIRTGTISLNQGDTLRIAVGGMGQKGQNNGSKVSGGGGGGGSSIVRVRGSAYEYVVFAGGGGGATSQMNGQEGLTTIDCTPNWGGSTGGVNGGGGGKGSASTGGGGGAGYRTDGATHCDGACNGTNVLAYGGQAYLSGNSGGATPKIGGDGGFGGGGEGGAATGSADGGGGGGGGWSGGGGGNVANYIFSGGAGGSYTAPGMDTTAEFMPKTPVPGNGEITIRLLENNKGFSYSPSGPSQFKVPVTGFYQLTAIGAGGGSSQHNQGGRGARMQGYFYLNANDILFVRTGGRGGYAEIPGSQVYGPGAGGGGATSIEIFSSSLEPLVVAGGGGGASQDTAGGPGLTTLNGGASRTSAGGINGNGGKANPKGSKGGGGGGGYLTNGENSVDSSGNILSYGGRKGGGIWPYQNDFLMAIGRQGGKGGGGQGGPISSVLDGGGGGAGGGGGGWSGGGSSQTNFFNAPYSLLPRVAAGGGGGGSYLSPKAITTGLNQTAGYNAGNGLATIIGPRTSTEVVQRSGSYTWPSNGVTYRSSGIYVWVDSVNAITRTLDLRITSLLGGGFAGPAGGSLMAYPNPSDGQLTLRTPSLNVAAKLEIYSVDGRRVQEYEVPAKTTRFHVDLRRHGAGVYIFRMTAEGEDEHIKVIVE